MLVARFIRIELHERRGVSERTQRSSLTSSDSVAPRPARLRALAASSRRTTATFTRLGKQPSLVQAFPQALGLATGQARVSRGVEHGCHIIIHAAALPLSSMANSLD